MNITELVREAGIYDGREGLMWCSKEQLERFAALVTAEKDKEIAELYEMSVKQAKTIKEYQDAEPVKQEPVAFVKENPFCPEGRSDELTIYLPVGTALYAAPVSAEAIRAEALEQAAKVCEDNPYQYAHQYAAAIRSLKEKP